MLREVPIAIWVLSAVSALAGAMAGCHPTGGPLADQIVSGLFAAVVVLVASQASWAAVLMALAVLAAVSPTLGFRVAAGIAVLACATLEWYRRLEPTLAAVLALVAVQGLLRLGRVGPEGGSALIAAVAVTVLVGSGLRRAPVRLRRPVVVLLVLSGGALAGGAVLATFSAIKANTSLDLARHETLAGLDAAQTGGRDDAAQRFRAASVYFGQADQWVDSWWSWPGRQLPVVGHQVRTLDLIASSGRDATDLAYDGATRIDPNRLRLVDGRIDLEAVRRYQPVFDEVARRTGEVRLRLDNKDSVWLAAPIRSGLSDFTTTVAKAHRSATTAATAAHLAPKILGGKGERHYLVAMVTPAEARASGGFMGNYAVLTARDGALKLGPVGRKEDLNRAGDQATKTITGPPDYVASYGRYDPAHTWENITMSPDFPSVAQAMAELFPQSGGRPVDGVIRIDPIALQSLLAITGPVTLPNLPQPLDDTNAADFLLRQQYAIFDDQGKRIDLLGDLAEAAFHRFTSGRGAPPAVVAEKMSPALQTGSVAFWFADPDEQAFVNGLGFADAVPPVDGGDSFGVTTQNAGASKIDVFLSRHVDYKARVDAATGAVTAKVEVVLKNDAPADGLPFYVIGNLVGLPSGTNHSLVSLYTPLDLRGATIDGAPLKLVAETELGRNVYRTYIDIGPGGSRTITLDLSGTVDLSHGDYSFDYVPQVLVRPDEVAWSLQVTGGEPNRARTHPGNIVRAKDSSVSVDWPVSAGPWSIDVPVTRD